MIAVFLHDLNRLRNQILGWGLSLALLVWVTVITFKPMFDHGQQMQAMLDAFPKELMAFFGDATNFLSTAGFLDLGLFSYLLVILGFFAVLAGSSLLLSDEESGRLDLVQAYPLSRTALFAGRALALAVATAAILAVGWLGFLPSLAGSELEANAAQLALPLVSLLAEMILFAGLALLLSMVLPSRGAAAMTAGFLLVASYFVTSLSRIVGALKDLARFSPYNYYQGANAISGLNWSWFFGLLGIAALFFLTALWLYRRRDLRVSGEGGWRLPGWITPWQKKA